LFGPKGEKKKIKARDIHTSFLAFGFSREGDGKKKKEGGKEFLPRRISRAWGRLKRKRR